MHENSENMSKNATLNSVVANAGKDGKNSKNRGGQSKNQDIVISVSDNVFRKLRKMRYFAKRIIKNIVLKRRMISNYKKCKLINKNVLDREILQNQENVWNTPCFWHYYNLENKKFVGQAPYPFSKKLFYKKNVQLWLDVGSGHGEMVYDWPVMVNKNTENWQKFVDFAYIASDVNKSKKSLSLQANPVVTIGFEIARKYYNKTLKKIQRIYDDSGLPVPYAFYDDGFKSLEYFKDQSVDGIFVLFPDPWYKTRHHKRRRITRDFFRLANQKLKNKGSFVLVTDHKDLYDFVVQEFMVFLDSIDKQGEESMLYKAGILNNLDKTGLAETHYYRKWLKHGKSKYYYLVFNV